MEAGSRGRSSQSRLRAGQGCKVCASSVPMTSNRPGCRQCVDTRSGRLLPPAREPEPRQGTWTGSFALDLDDLLEMLRLQGGRCHYSRVPLHCAAGPADWVWSIERLDNSVTYAKNNCVLIAREFQTSDQSRNKAVHPIFGTAQWSRRKVSHVWGPHWLPDVGLDS